MEPQKEALIAAATATLKENRRGDYTIPASGLYPHQWLWDSCFIAIGLRHIDIEMAKKEILHLLSGQWSNGMLPHMILAPGSAYRADRSLWRSFLSPNAPEKVATSGLTQPPIIAEAVIRIGKSLPITERRSWYRQVYPALVKYHQWLYTERDPHGEGLVLCVHPYETGLDNTPPWVIELKKHNMPSWISAIERLKLIPIVELMRRDTRRIPPGQRMSTIEALAYFSALRRLRRKSYNTEAILSRSLFAIEDINFNSILIRNNHNLLTIARAIKGHVPESLRVSISKADLALEQLWDVHDQQYFSRNFVTHKLITEFTIGTLMPLYAGNISQERAQYLVKLLRDPTQFGLRFPIPTVPKNSHYFNPIKYWQGPSWVNTNWLIIDGLKRYGFVDEAEQVKNATLALVAKHGMFEYFNPLTGQPEGAKQFSWTAALTIDLLKQ